MQLPAPGYCGPGFVSYSNGTDTPLATGGVNVTYLNPNPLAEISSGGPFDEPYFQGAEFGAELFELARAGVGLGVGDFTVDVWYRVRSAVTDILPRIIQWQNPDGPDGVQVYLAPRRTGFGQQPEPSLNIFTNGDSYYHINKTIAFDVWRHLAIQRKNNIMTAWDDGQSITAVWFNEDYAEPLDYGTTTTFIVGDDGAIDVGQIRVVADRAMYPTGSVIPVPSAPWVGS